MTNSNPSNKKESSSKTEDHKSSSDVWEAEIDLHEVGKGILEKWYIWIAIPLATTVMVGLFFVLQPDHYRISGTLTLNANQTQLNEVTVDFPPRDILENNFRNQSKFQQLLDEHGLLKDVENPEEFTLNFIQNQLVISDTQFETGFVRFDISLETPIPDTFAPVLNERFEQFRTNHTRSLLDRLHDRRAELEDREGYFDNEWQKWRAKWRNLKGDSLPALLEPRYQNAREHYERSVQKLDDVQEKRAELTSQKNSIQRLLENEPVTFSYQSPYLPFFENMSPPSETEESPSSMASSEAINEAYQDLRKRRVSTNVALSEIQQRIENHKVALKKNRKQYLEIRRKLPSLKKRVEELKARRDFLENSLQETRSSLDTIDSLINSTPQFFEIYPAEPPGIKIDTNRPRNTLLAGVISFLLLFFGVAFWEIL